MGVHPDAMAGHSVGEWTAMIASGVYAGASVDAFLESFDPDALRVPGLAFAALGAAADRVLDALATVEGMSEVVLSHDNAPQQSIVCGPRRPVTELVQWFRAQGVLGQLLPFQSGFHTPMLAPYLGPIRQAAERFELHRPAVPLWSGTTAAPFPQDEAAVRALFIRHLLEPVRFRPLVEALYAAGFRAFVQVGTGQLASLVGDTLGDREHLAIAANSPQRDGLAQLRRVAAALWVDGADLDPTALRPAAVAQSRPERPHPAVPLDLGGALVSLDPAALATLRADLAEAVAASLPQPPAPTSTPTSTPTAPVAPGLASLADRFPLAAELDALLRDTERAATELIGAARPSAMRTAPPQYPHPRTRAGAPADAPAAARPAPPAADCTSRWTPCPTCSTTASSASARAGPTRWTAGRSCRPPPSCST